MAEPSAHYTVLARRYRPQAFDQVVGQEHVATALRNAIRTDRVAHAYLFTGARGVGKTSTARILAKALNCPHVVDGVPCQSCDVCESITAGRDVDIVEIDGASNRGIDDIRALRANVGVKSMRTKYKMYIIDEVHMLTKEAFNALLKTLEEPPANVKFVFCTTEPHKVPDTILSRCQRFDFSAITDHRIGDRLLEIAAAEGFDVDAAAIELVARRAAGSMRDSQSLFDQLLAFGDRHITVDDAHRLFGTADDERLLSLGDQLLAGSHGAALAELEATLAAGIQPAVLVDQLVEYFRDLMVVASGAGQADLLSVANSSRDRLAEQARRWGLRRAVAALELLSETRLRLSRIVAARPVLELALVRIGLLEDLDQLAELAAHIRAGRPIVLALESEKKNSPPPDHAPAQPSLAPPAAPQSTTPVAPQRAISNPVVPPSREGPPPGPQALASTRPTSPPSSRQPAPTQRNAPPVVIPAPAAESIRKTVPSRTRLDNRPDESCAPFADDGQVFRSDDATDDEPDWSSLAGEEETLSETAVDRSPSTVGERNPGSPAEESQHKPLADWPLDELWRQVELLLPSKTRAYFRPNSGLAILGPNRLAIQIPAGYSVKKDLLDASPQSLRELEQGILQMTGQAVQVVTKLLASGSADSPQTLVTKTFNAEDDPLIQAACELFQGTIREVEPARRKAAPAT